MPNANLRIANREKKDEFYTQLNDIEKELRNYKNQFNGKVVFCNCDDPKESNFVKYFSMNFEHLGLKKLIATHYKGANLFTQERPYKLVYTGDKDGNRMPDSGEFFTEMIGTGDFRSTECVELLSESDIVVTNPPFSLFREYVAQLIKYNKKFLLLGNMNAITYKDIFKLISENKLWSGFGFNMSLVYKSPYVNNLDANRKFVVDKGYDPDNGYVKVPAINWYTNLDVSKHQENLNLYKKYSDNPEYFPKFDNYNAININKVSDIPSDYSGLMGVPITFLDKYNPKQFEIIEGLNRYTVLDVDGLNKHAKENHLHMTEINGKSTYFRIIIKHKKA